MLGQNLLDFGRRIRAAVDALSPETEMGMSGSGEIFHNDSAAIKYARVIAGPGRPFIRIPAAIYDSNASLVTLFQNLGAPPWNFTLCPRDICRIHEMDTYPHNRFYMPDAMVAALMAYTTSLGAEGFLFYGTQYLDDPLEDDGYFRVLKRENAKLMALRDAVRDRHLAGVRLVGRETGLTSIVERYGWPFRLDGDGPALLAGSAAGQLDDAALKALLERGGVVLDGQAAANATARGFGELIGAEVRPSKPLPAFREQILPAAGELPMVGRRVYNMSFAAPTPAEKSDFFEVANPRPGVEPLVEYRNPAKQSTGIAVYRYEAPSGARIGVVGMTMPWNRSASLFSTRKREVLADLLEWTARREIPVRIAKEPNVMLLANADNDERTLILTVINLRPDILDGLALKLGDGWADASAEEMDDAGEWHALNLPSAVSRIRRIEGAFAPGISRIFRLTKA